ncbi:IspD/TarI family cytidylyltransferase [Ancylobacter sp.]|uniref:IspD/TarI family cytidylyltransferase n=1 Tax=Ancylobacter sp. TaxID=1872567 RepID=UPI003D0DE0F1
MKIQGLIQAAGSGTRLGLGSKAFVELGGRTLLEHAVELLLPEVDSLVIAVATPDIDRARALITHEHTHVIAGTQTRSGTTRRLMAEATAPWLLLHDVVHPFASSELVRTLLQQAMRSGAAAPGLVNTEFVYSSSGDLIHTPGEVLIGQKPVAFGRDAACAGYARLPKDGLDSDPSFLDILELGGVKAAFVPGSAVNIKITTPDDLMLAQALLSLKA